MFSCFIRNSWICSRYCLTLIKILGSLGLPVSFKCTVKITSCCLHCSWLFQNMFPEWEMWITQKLIKHVSFTWLCFDLVVCSTVSSFEVDPVKSITSLKVSPFLLWFLPTEVWRKKKSKQEARWNSAKLRIKVQVCHWLLTYLRTVCNSLCSGFQPQQAVTMKKREIAKGKLKLWRRECWPIPWKRSSEEESLRGKRPDSKFL